MLKEYRIVIVYVTGLYNLDGYDNSSEFFRREVHRVHGGKSMEYKAQIVALVVVLTILFNFFRNKRMPFLSTKMFSNYILVTFFNLLFEIFSLYTLLHMDVVPEVLNRFAHQLFIGTLDLSIFFLYVYVDIKVREQKRYSVKELIIRILPLVFAMVMVVFGDLQYYKGTDGVYSYGTMAMTVYLSVIIYISLIIICLFVKRNRFGKQERSTILVGVSSWVIIASIQFFNPTMLISSIALALMALFVYISLENPREYMDCDMENVFSRKAYNLVITEELAAKQKFWIVNVALMNEPLLRNTYGAEAVPHTLEHIAKAISHYMQKDAYHSHRKMVAAISKDKKVCEKEFLDGLLEEIRKELIQKHEMTDLRISILECPTYAETYTDVESIMDFINSRRFEEEVELSFVINQSMVEKHKYYETVDVIVQKALREDGLEVFYQPIYSTGKRAFVSAEALVRVKDRETVGYISPDVFIPIAERRGYIGELGKVVFDKVCRFYKDNALQDLGVDYIDVNLSGQQVADHNLPHQLIESINQYELTPNRITLEITETAAVTTEEVFVRNVERLQGVGFGFSMDDFGTGYSNLSKMSDMDFDLIKLDKSLLWPCFDEKNKEALVIFNCCVDMIQQLGYDIVAEGVETKEQVDMLTEKGVAYLQGYYFSKPLSEEQYLEFMKAQQKK